MNFALYYLNQRLSIQIRSYPRIKKEIFQYIINERITLPHRILTQHEFRMRGQILSLLSNLINSKTLEFEL